MFKNYTPLLNKLKKFYGRERRMPTYREMVKLFALSSTGAVAYIIKKWLKLGLLIQEGKTLVPGSGFFDIPLLGAIRAGAPTESPETYDTLSLQKLLLRQPDQTFALKVHGDSMINEGIKEGDTVIIDKTKSAKNGDVVAALVDGEWTLKYLVKRQQQYYLKAANPHYRDIHPSQSLELGGVVIGVIRTY